MGSSDSSFVAFVFVGLVVDEADFGKLAAIELESKSNFIRSSIVEDMVLVRLRLRLRLGLRLRLRLGQPLYLHPLPLLRGCFYCFNQLRSALQFTEGGVVEEGRWVNASPPTLLLL